MNSQSGSSVNGSQGGGGKVGCSDSSDSMHTDHDGDVKMVRKDGKEDVDTEVTIYTCIYTTYVHTYSYIHILLYLYIHTQPYILIHQEMEDEGMMWETLSDVSEMSDL